ncbi:MAG: hypothetical protein ABSC91_01640 [Candidatus Bathyarchaeia archaeon]
MSNNKVEVEYSLEGILTSEDNVFVLFCALDSALFPRGSRPYPPSFLKTKPAHAHVSRLMTRQVSVRNALSNSCPQSLSSEKEKQQDGWIE